MRWKFIFSKIDRRMKWERRWMKSFTFWNTDVIHSWSMILGIRVHEISGRDNYSIRSPKQPNFADA